MHNINITVREKIAVNPAQDRYVCGNSDYIVRFDFDAEWAAHDTKTARFIAEDGTYKEQVFTGNECPVPVMSDTYKIMVGVYAGNLSTTTAAYVPCKKSILCGGGVHKEPEPDVYIQLMQLLNDNKNVFVVKTVGSVADRTVEEIDAAIAAGKVCVLLDWDSCVYTYYGKIKDYTIAQDIVQTFLAPGEYIPGKGIAFKFVQVFPDGKASVGSYSPARTANPYPMTLTGAVEAVYDGSKAVKVEVLPVPANADATAYLRWNGKAWVAATIADLKADLGLT